MNAELRAQMLKRVHKRVLSHTMLPHISREYSLYEIAIITRAGPARALGLRNKEHLGPGADADLAIYAEAKDKEEMFERAAYVLKDGQIVVRDGEVIQSCAGRTIFADVPRDDDLLTELRDQFEKYYTSDIGN